MVYGTSTLMQRSKRDRDDGEKKEEQDGKRNKDSFAETFLAERDRGEECVWRDRKHQ